MTKQSVSEKIVASLLIAKWCVAHTVSLNSVRMSKTVPEDIQPDLASGGRKASAVKVWNAFTDTLKVKKGRTQEREHYQVNKHKKQARARR